MRFGSFLFILVLTLFEVKAQELRISDYRFVTVFQDENKLDSANRYNAPIIPSIMMYSEFPGCVNISCDVLGYDTIISLSPLVPKIIELPANRPFYDMETIAQRVVEIKSNFPINVIHGFNWRLVGHPDYDSTSFFAITEAQSLLNPNQWGDSYILNQTTSGWTNDLLGFDGLSYVSLVSVDDNTNIEYTLNCNSYFDEIQSSIPNAELKFKDSSYTIGLDYLENYNLLLSGNYFQPKGASPVGTTFNSNRNFGVYTRGYDTRCEDIGWPISAPMEQLLPVKYFGTQFHIPFLEGGCCNSFKIVSSKDSNVIWVNGQDLFYLDSLEYADTTFSISLYMTSKYPINVYMYVCPFAEANMGKFNAGFSAVANSDDQLVKRSNFSTITEQDSNYIYLVGLVTKTANLGLLKIDGLPVNSSLFQPFVSDSVWSWANLEVDTGLHIVVSDSGFHGVHYNLYPDTLFRPVGRPVYGYNLPSSPLLVKDSLSFQIKTKQNPWRYFQDYDTVVCTGDLLTFKPNVARFTTWHWNFGDGTDTLQKVDYEAPGVVTHSYIQPGLYWVVVQDSANCTTGDSVLIEVVDGPMVQFSHTATQSCQGVWVQLQNHTQGANSYTWQLPNGEISTQENPGFFYEVGNPVTVSLTATNSQCSQTQSQTFTPQVQNFNANEIPNVFTPNADGENDCYSIPNTLGFAECYQLNIYNRWGGEVFSSKVPSQCWDGDELPDGVYFYTLTLGKKTYQGEVHVLR